MVETCQPVSTRATSRHGDMIAVFLWCGARLCISPSYFSQGLHSLLLRYFGSLHREPVGSDMLIVTQTELVHK